MALLSAAVLMILSVFTAHCKTSSSIVAKDVTANTGRLFTIEVGIDTAESLTAATFDFEYDGRYIDFRRIDRIINDSCVKSAVGKDKVKTIFLKSDGVSPKDCRRLFSITFKAEKKCESAIRIKCSDCVNIHVKNFASPKSMECKVRIQGKSLSSSTENKNHWNKKHWDKNSDADSNSDSKEDESRIISTEKENKGIVESFVTATESRYWLVVAIMVVVVIAGAVAGYFMAKKTPKI